MRKTPPGTTTRVPGQRSRQQHSGQPRHQPRDERATPINHNWLTTVEAAARLRQSEVTLRRRLARHARVPPKASSPASTASSPESPAPAGSFGWDSAWT